MPDMLINASMARRGPLFDGRTATALAVFPDQVSYKIATYAEDQVRQRLQQVLRHPTGYYRSRITVDRAGAGYRVSDGGVIYGPWLEGTGSRNYPATAFHGYATFRRVKALVDRRAPALAQEQAARLKAAGLL